jgi:hypothetical protein
MTVQDTASYLMLSNGGTESCSVGALLSVFDGKDMLQYAVYTIKKGPHSGKRILSYMGEHCHLEWESAFIF